METCENCGRVIGNLESPHLWNENVVCAGCHVTLAGLSVKKALPSQAGKNNVWKIVVPIAFAAIGMAAIGWWQSERVLPTADETNLHADYAKACEPLLERLDRICSDIQFPDSSVDVQDSKIKDDMAATDTAMQAWNRSDSVVNSRYLSKKELDKSFDAFEKWQINSTSISVVDDGLGDALRCLDTAKKLLADGQ
jgi:hypothetical protein